MSTELEIRERQKEHLKSLLDIKKANGNREVLQLDAAIRNVLVRMNQEDIAWVEKIAEVKSID